jgi:hypothetical protein
MDTHSCDNLLSCIIYAKHILFYPYLYFDSTEILISLGLLSAIPQLVMYAYIDFPLTAMLLARPHPKFGTFFSLKGYFKCANKELKNKCICYISIIAYFNLPFSLLNF